MQLRDPITGMGPLHGVSFDVRPHVSPCRRLIRMEVSQKINQLLGIDRTKELDLHTGKQVEIESPNVRQTVLAGSVRLQDLGAILMPVAYRPAVKEQDKVWLIVARPMIWIEAEMKLVRENGKQIVPKSAWDDDPPGPHAWKPDPPPPTLPLTPDVREILQALITDLLTGPGLKDSRDFYGTPKDKTVALIDGELGWPKDFHPSTHGYKVVRPDPFENQRRILGICLNTLDLQQKKSMPIEVVLHNAGGSANGGVIGRCFVSYVATRVGRRWTVEFREAFDP